MTPSAPDVAAKSSPSDTPFELIPTSLKRTQTMQTGTKAQPPADFKFTVQRHGHKRGTGRRSYARCEKAIETKTRRAGKAACKETF